MKLKNWPHMQITDPKSYKCQFAVVRMTLMWLIYLRGKSRVALNTRTLHVMFFPQSRKLALFGCNAKYLNGRRKKKTLTTFLCSTLFLFSFYYSFSPARRCRFEEERSSEEEDCWSPRACGETSIYTDSHSWPQYIEKQFKHTHTHTNSSFIKPGIPKHTPTYVLSWTEFWLTRAHIETTTVSFKCSSPTTHTVNTHTHLTPTLTFLLI